jgi:hypothetical protein
MMDFELRDAVALNMHPWLTPSRRDGQIVLQVPPWRDVLDAAEAVIKGIEGAGYKITKVEEQP